MAREDDRSEAHLSWLVRSRSANQDASLNLYLFLVKYESVITDNITIVFFSEELTAVSFSLWRAVFLSDLSGVTEDRFADITNFLGNLVSNNAIAYPQDKNAREFTFHYYLSDAFFRLAAIAETDPLIVADGTLDIVDATAKQQWTIAHNALTSAIAKLGAKLETM